MLNAFITPISIGFSHAGYNFLVNWYRGHLATKYEEESRMSIMKYRMMIAEKELENQKKVNTYQAMMVNNHEPIVDAEYAPVQKENVVDDPNTFQASWSSRVVK